MSDIPPTETILVVNNHVIRLTADRSDGPRTLTIRIDVDGGRSWVFEEPGWQEIRLGVFDNLMYLWSARRLSVLSSEPILEPSTVAVDEDIHFVFHHLRNWVLVCETSVRLFFEDKEIHRLEFGDVLLAAKWDGPLLQITDANEQAIAIKVSIDRLEIVPIRSQT